MDEAKKMQKIEVIGDVLAVIVPSQSASSTSASEASKDAWLVEAAQHGSREAFGRLYDRYASMVHGILLARTPHSEVDDLVQDVFLTAFKKMNTLRDTNAFGGWLATIARNRANDFHRSYQPTEEIPEDLSHHNRASGETATEATKVLEAIRSLSEAYSETLILRLVEGLTGPEIAERTGLTPASVRVNLHRGMKLLREKLSLEVSA